MGCDGYASEEGVLVIKITRYDTSEVLKEIRIEGLAPNEKILEEWVVGKPR